MGLIILIVVGAILGWLASIITRAEDRQGILLNVGAGVIGALLAGIATNGSSILLGISAIALFASFAGAVVLLAVVFAVRRRAVP